MLDGELGPEEDQTSPGDAVDPSAESLVALREMTCGKQAGDEGVPGDGDR
jgi:hypothetical protein